LPTQRSPDRVRKSYASNSFSRFSWYSFSFILSTFHEVNPRFFRENADGVLCRRVLRELVTELLRDVLRLYFGLLLCRVPDFDATRVKTSLARMNWRGKLTP